MKAGPSLLRFPDPGHHRTQARRRGAAACQPCLADDQQLQSGARACHRRVSAAPSGLPGHGSRWGLPRGVGGLRGNRRPRRASGRWRSRLTSRMAKHGSHGRLRAVARWLRLSARASRRCVTIFALSEAAGPWRDEAVRLGYRSCVAIPLLSEGRALGALASVLG